MNRRGRGVAPAKDGTPFFSRGTMRHGWAFLAVSAIIAFADILFISINYLSDSETLFQTLTDKGEQQRLAFDLAVRTEGTHMQQLATYFSNTRSIQELFLAGRQAVESEGGGPGGDAASDIRRRLYGLVSSGWRKLTNDFRVRQLHFHLGPGDTSFLRVHRPEKFGDDLTPVRHSIVHTNRTLMPTQGFESGRVYAGIRGVVPAFAKDPQSGAQIHVGAIEAGSSFRQLLKNMNRETATAYGVLLTLEHVKETYWPDFLKRQFKKNPSVGNWYVEAATDPGKLRTLLLHPEVHRSLGERLPVLVEEEHKAISVYSFPLRDFIGDINPEQPAIGAVLAWTDAQPEVTAFRSTLRNNIILGVGGFLVVELILYLSWGLAHRQLISLVDRKTRELNDANQDLAKEVEMRRASEQALAGHQARLEEEVKARTDDLSRSVEALSYQATHDALTGLANRSVLERGLKSALDDAVQNGTMHAFLYIDLDQFKIVNDTSGHTAGDELLRQVATLMKKHVRPNDILARLGGDEFGMVLSGCSLEKGVQIAESLLETVRDFRFIWSDKTFEIGVSIGVVRIDSETPHGQQILSAADTACFMAKEKGRNRVHALLLDDADLSRRKSEMQWITRLQEALKQDRFVLYAQPIVSTRQPHSPAGHYEILVRMIDEDDKIISPGNFIPAAERYGLMPKIDRWIIRHAFQHWRQQARSEHNHASVSYAINLSGSSLDDEHLLGFIKEELVANEVPPENVCFEITETAAISNLSKAHDLMINLKAIGCRFALDDFGSGLSSFGYLKTLPVDYLKIDGAFVRGIDKSEVDRAMVQAINAVGHAMKLKTIAEFVESEDILQCILELEVDYAQGWGVGAPRPLEEYTG